MMHWKMNFIRNMPKHIYISHQKRDYLEPKDLENRGLNKAICKPYAVANLAISVPNTAAGLLIKRHVKFEQPHSFKPGR